MLIHGNDYKGEIMKEISLASILTSLYLSVIFILISTNVFIPIYAYNRGKLDQKVEDDQKWNEDMILGKNLPITQTIKEVIK